MFTRKKLMKMVLFTGLALMVYAPKPGVTSPEKPHQMETLTVYTSARATSNWALAQGLSDILKKYHPWLRIEVKDTPSAIETITHLALYPEKRKNSFIYCDPNTKYMAEKRIPPFNKPPFDKPYTTLKPMVRLGTTIVGWVTFNPNIKTIYDLAGKKADVGPKGSGTDIILASLPLRAAGIRVDKEYLGWRKGKDALVDGLIDAYYAALVMSNAKPLTWSPFADFQEVLVMRGKDLHFVQMPKDVVMEAKKEVPSLNPRILLKRSIGGTDLPPEDINWIDWSLGWMADIELDNGLVYELVKTIFEQLNQFAYYHEAGKSFIPELMTDLPYKRDEWHPGAVKFYEEKGIKFVYGK